MKGQSGPSAFDYVVVGAGAAGCVVAARLTEDPAVQVLLLEAGSERHNPLLSIPAAEVLWMGKPRYDWCFETEADPTLDGRSVRIPRGRLVGGSNAINGMIFVRGQREDYDSWSTSGNPGWSWDDVLPYFRRLERVDGLDGDSRGHDGRISISPLRERDELTDAFLVAAVEAGYRSNPDYNSGVQEGFGYYQVTQEAGRRSSAAGTYLKQARARPNLTLRTGAHVNHLRFDAARCVGVRYRRGGALHDVACSREVILCAGVVQSPQILELSGIGQPDVLARAGVRVLRPLPGVGENFRDHFAVRLKWRVRQPITFNERTHGARFVEEIARYAIGRRGVLSLPVALGFGFVRSTSDEIRPDVQFHFAPASYSQAATRRLDTLPGMTLGVYPLRPESQGSVHIRSNDPAQPPAIRPRFLEHELDRARLLVGIRIGRAIVGGSALDRYRGAELVPGPDVQTDDELLDFVRTRGDTSYHPVGTCRMGNDAMAVVDHRLRVRGLHGVRVIDSSVMPSMVSGNTNAATFMIAEKGAAMVVEAHLSRGRAQSAVRTVAKG